MYRTGGKKTPMKLWRREVYNGECGTMRIKHGWMDSKSCTPYMCAANETNNFPPTCNAKLIPNSCS